MAQRLFDVVIVGGGPAGLSAALVLGRCRRSVAICDDGKPRNAASRAAHGFFTRDGVPPAELIRRGREQLLPYDVSLFDARCVEVRTERRTFTAELADDREVSGRKLLLATGIVDGIPAIDGAASMYGISVFPCPYCDAWEMRDQPLAIYGRGPKIVSFAIGMRAWSHDLVLCTDGCDETIGDEAVARLARHGISIRAEHIVRLDGKNGFLERIVFEHGGPLMRRALFFNTPSSSSCDFARKLGCEVTSQSMVAADAAGRTNIAGLYVAGDLTCDLNFIAIAAAEGLKAACAIHKELEAEDVE